MQTDPSRSPPAHIQVAPLSPSGLPGEVDDGGEELNAAEVTERALAGDLQSALVDRSTGKNAGARIRLPPTGKHSKRGQARCALEAPSNR